MKQPLRRSFIFGLVFFSFFSSVIFSPFFVSGSMFDFRSTDSVRGRFFIHFPANFGVVSDGKRWAVKKNMQTSVRSIRTASFVGFNAGFDSNCLLGLVLQIGLRALRLVHFFSSTTDDHRPITKCSP